MKTTTRIHASPVSDKNGQRPDTPAGFPARLASRWLDGLIAERGLSRNTVAAYRQDLDALRDFLDELETPLSGLDDENITLFIAWLRKRGDATRTLARRISSLRSFLAWCVERGELASNPAALIDTPKLPSLLPDVLTQDEIIRLLNAPDATSKLGLRDRAMLELLYAAGMRVSELIELQPIDLDLQRGVVRIFGKGSKERLVPLHDAAVMRMAEYLKIVRPLFTPLKTGCSSTVPATASPGRASGSWSNATRWRLASENPFPRTRSGTPSPPTCWKAERISVPCRSSSAMRT